MQETKKDVDKELQETQQILRVKKLLVGKTKKVKKQNKRLAKYFKNVDGIEFFTEPENCFSNYWLNVVILPDHDKQLKFLQETNDNGVMTRPIWELMNRLPMFENCEHDSLENAIRFADRVVNIPSSVRLVK